MERFKIKYVAGNGFFSNEKVVLFMRVPYKNCFGKIKWKYKKVYKCYKENLYFLGIKSKSEVINHVIDKFMLDRKHNKISRIIKKLE